MSMVSVPTLFMLLHMPFVKKEFACQGPILTQIQLILSNDPNESPIEANESVIICMFWWC